MIVIDVWMNGLVRVKALDEARQHMLHSCTDTNCLRPNWKLSQELPLLRVRKKSRILAPRDRQLLELRHILGRLNLSLPLLFIIKGGSPYFYGLKRVLLCLQFLHQLVNFGIGKYIHLLKVLRIA